LDGEWEVLFELMINDSASLKPCWFTYNLVNSPVLFGTIIRKMKFLFTLLAGIVFPAPPTFVGCLIWVALLGTLAYALFRWRSYQPAWNGREWGLFFVFLILIPITSLFIGIRLTSASARPLPGLPADAPGSALMIFSAIPWLLGGGLLGPVGAAVLGACAGLLRGAWDTYSLFSVVELAIFGTWFSTNMRQRYRTKAFALLRQPLVGALLLIPFHTLFYIISSLFTQWGCGCLRASHCET
jgi:hypothetical protein